MSVETVDVEPVDVTPVDAALMQDKFDDLSVLTPQPTEDLDADKPRRTRSTSEKKMDDKAKSGPPSLDEWQAFIGRFIIRTITDAYVSRVLGDIEDELTPRERDMIALDPDDINGLAAPFATLANKSPKLRKHGRSIIATADSFDSVFAMALWTRRVNKLRRKYRKSSQKRSGQVVQGEYQEGPNGYAGQDERQGTYTGNAPGFGVWNPGTGG